MYMYLGPPANHGGQGVTDVPTQVMSQMMGMMSGMTGNTCCTAFMLYII